MPSVMERIFAAPRLIHIHGAPSVGKTAFCFKVVYDLVDKQPDARALWIYFDDEIDYWRSVFEVHRPEAPVSYLKIETKSTEHCYRMFGKAMEGNPYKLVIIDGLQYTNIDLAGPRRAELFSFFCVQSERFGLPILVTDRKPVRMDTCADPRDLPAVYTHAELWKLHRPAYYTDPQRKQEAYVVMPRELRWPDQILAKRHYLP
jgi:GTPase SAR1 family protein